MKQTLQLKLSQHLALTPQLQQSIRLLQLSTLELNQEIEQFLQDNPLLEREESIEDTAFVSLSGAAPEAPQTSEAPSGDDNHFEASSSAESAAPSDDDLGWGVELGSHNGTPRDENDDTDFADIQAATTGLSEHLHMQLAMLPLPDRDRAMVAFIIEALDDDGYLSLPLGDLLDALPDDIAEDPEELLGELQIALKHVQNFDPPGVGAQSPGECLGLQLMNIAASPVRDLALSIVTQHLELLANRDFVRIKKLLGCDEDLLREAQTLVRSLNPRPGAQFAALDTRYVVPDVVVRKVRGRWVASLNQEAMPRLRINRLYAQILQGNRGSSLAGQLQEAKWLIKNVQQRFDTILRVSQAIIERQRQFFDHGEVAMRPLTLREIADTVELHESTISRVTTQKYLASPRGIFELKYFFGSHVATDSGGAASSTAIRALIKQLVSAEDGQKPLSDARIAEILGEQGIVVARRTVAKYREALSIPPVNLRKTL